MENESPKRPWKGVIFSCCGIYGRIYRSLTSGLYEGNCPRCGRKFILQTWLKNLLLGLLWLGLCSPVQAQSTPPKTLQPLHPDSSSRATQSLLSDVDSLKIRFFIQPGLAFLQFDEQERFEDWADQQISQYYLAALNETDSSYISQQKFQQVLFCFPVHAGLDWQFYPGFYLTAGMGFMHTRESVILIDQRNRAQEIFFAVQSVPAFLECRMLMPASLLTITQGRLFFMSFRWWWLLQGTELYSNYGVLKAHTDRTGQGWSLHLGYELFRSGPFQILGDFSFSAIRAQSKQTWKAVVPGEQSEKAEWDLGGIQMSIRASIGL